MVTEGVIRLDASKQVEKFYLPCVLDRMVGQEYYSLSHIINYKDIALYKDIAFAV